MEMNWKRLWPFQGWIGKVGVLMCLAATALATDLDRGEEHWRLLVQEATPTPPTSLDHSRSLWASDSSHELSQARLLEQSDATAAANLYSELLSASSDSLVTLICLERLAHLEIAAHDIPAATVRLERTLRLADDLAQPMAAARAHLDMGRVLIRTREMDAAAVHLEQASTVAVELDLGRWQGDAALALSIVHRLRMDLDTALALREQAYDAYTSANWLPGRARSRHYIGTTHAMRGELTLAMIDLQAAEVLARESGIDDILSGCLGDQAGIHFLTGDFDLALAQYAESSDLTNDPRRKGWYLTNMASILAHQERYADALPRLEQALEIIRASGDRRTESTILLQIGESRCALGDLEGGLRDLDAAATHAREFELPLDEAKALEVKGHALLDIDRQDEARSLLEDVRLKAEALDYFDLLESVHFGLAKIARQQNRLEDATGHLDQAMDIVLRVRRLSGGSTDVQSGYFSQTGRSFDAMVAVLFDRFEHDSDTEYGHRAWEVAQLSRARSLLDLLAEAEVDLHVRADASFRERETAILEGVADLEQRRTASPDSVDVLNAEIRRLEGQLEVLAAELRVADPRYAELRYPRPVGLAEARASVLQPGEAFLEYQLGETSSHLWFVSRDRFVFHRLPAKAEIEHLVGALLPLLRDPNLTGDAAAWYAAPARSAAAILIDPILGELTDIERLIIVPDGALHYLPFDALLVRDSSATSFHDLPWLAAEVEIATTPSISALARLRSVAQAPASASPLLLLADPVLPDPDHASVFVRAAGADGLHPVPGAAAEQQRLIDIHGRAAHWWSGEHATADKLTTAGPWRSIHLITHGLFNEERPQYSGLVLSPGEDDDGFLDVAKIFSLNLDCDQVVLSACSSALGEQVDGEGLVGLTHAFLYAGARSVVAALWDVGGDGAAQFMGDYYQALSTDGQSSRAAALTTVKRSMSHSDGRTSGNVPLAHPSVWAAFVSTGDAR
jgi:CHAT domain-containing protein/tetratricopeptide (TPR) repeat protein